MVTTNPTGWWPFKVKEAAQTKAKTLRKQGYRVRVTKAKLYAASRGFRWEVSIVGRRKLK